MVHSSIRRLAVASAILSAGVRAQIQNQGCVDISTQWAVSDEIHPNGPETCQQHCTEKNYAYSGLLAQFCACWGSAPNIIATHDAGDCYFNCDDPYADESCGGMDQDPSSLDMLYNLYFNPAIAAAAPPGTTTTTPAAATTTPRVVVSTTTTTPRVGATTTISPADPASTDLDNNNNNAAGEVIITTTDPEDGQTITTTITTGSLPAGSDDCTSTLTRTHMITVTTECPDGETSTAVVPTTLTEYYDPELSSVTTITTSSTVIVTIVAIRPASKIQETAAVDPLAQAQVQPTTTLVAQTPAAVVAPAPQQTTTLRANVAAAPYSFDNATSATTTTTRMNKFSQDSDPYSTIASVSGAKGAALEQNQMGLLLGCILVAVLVVA